MDIKSMARRGRSAFSLTALVVCMLLLAACGTADEPAAEAEPAANVEATTAETETEDDSAEAATGPISIEHEAGTLELEEPAVRVAVMQWQFLENLIALGVQPVMIADEQQPGSTNEIPPQFEGLLGDYVSLGARTSPNLELLASQPVDLIVVDSNEHLENFGQFSSIAPTLALDTWDWDEFFPNIEKLGAATGNDEAAAALIADLQGQIDAAGTQLGAAIDLRVVLAVPTADRFFAFTSNSLQGGLMTELGATYAYQAIPGKLTEQVDLEALPAMEPGALFLAPVDGPTVIETWEGNDVWEGLPAVQNDRVFVLDREVWSVGRGAMSVPMMIEQTLEVVQADSE